MAILRVISVHLVQNVAWRAVQTGSSGSLCSRQFTRAHDPQKGAAGHELRAAPQAPEHGTVLTRTAEHRSAGVVVAAVGEIDLQTTEPFHQGMLDTATGRPTVLVLDLERIEFLGSSGLAALVEPREQLAPDTAVHLVATTHTILRPLQGTGLLPVFPHSRTVEQALGGEAVHPDRTGQQPLRTQVRGQALTGQRGAA